MSDIILSQLLLEKCNNEQPTGETIKIALKSKKRTLLCQFDNTSQFLSLSARSMKEIRVNPTYDRQCCGWPPLHSTNAEVFIFNATGEAEVMDDVRNGT